MAKDGIFATPKYNDVIETDPQITQITLEKMDWGARKSAQGGALERNQTIVHVKSNG